MSDYTIIATYPCNEEGYVYVDALVGKDANPRRLILPDVPEDAQKQMDDYVAAPENSGTDQIETVETPLDVLVEQPAETEKPVAEEA